MSLTNLEWCDIIKRALKEDIGSIDITTETLVPYNSEFSVNIVARSEGIIAGLSIVEYIMKKLDPDCILKMMVKDGQKVAKNTCLISIKGKAQAILQGERVALNFIQHLSGIATQTNLAVQKISKYNCQVLDTRKTTPGIRCMEKYAVSVGGGYNHRYNLQHAVMIKDNHYPFIKNIGDAVQKLRKIIGPFTPIIVEVENLLSLTEALNANVEFILLDNFSIKDLHKAISLADKDVFLEASGKITLENIAEIASTGVHAVSMGWLTHSAKAMDIGLDIEKEM